MVQRPAEAARGEHHVQASIQLRLSHRCDTASDAAASPPVRRKAGGTALEEVIVTAQKRAQNLQDIPIAVTAFSAADIERRNFSNIAQLADFTPNVIFDTTTSISGLSSGAAVFIRGIGQIDFGLTTDPGVGTYVDGVYMSRSVGGVLDTLDIERIEILRGPQGTLFGRNTMGGALNITSQRPGREFGGLAELTLGDFDRIDVRAAVDLPLGDTLGLRLAASSKQRDGYVDRLLVGDVLGDENRQSFRAALLWTPSNRFELYATADYAQIDEASAGSVLAGITQAPNVIVYNLFDAPGNHVPGFGDGIPYDERFITHDPDTTYADGPTGTNLDIGGAALTLVWSLESLEIKSITAYRTTSGEFFRDPDNSPLVITHTSNPDYDHEQLTQEFTFTGEAGPLEYVAGLFYLTEEGTDNVFVPLAPSLGFITNLADIDNDSAAVYGQATWHVTDQLRLTGGLRYTEDDKTFTPFQRILFGAAGPAPGVSVPLIPDDTVDARFDQATGRLAVEFKQNDEALYYASFTQGFKSGGFNFRYVVPRDEALAFDPETVDSYELGFKWQGAEDRLRLNANVFFMDYQDIQVQVFEVGGGPLTQNAGTADIRGAELELMAVPTPSAQPRARARLHRRRVHRPQPADHGPRRQPDARRAAAEHARVDRERFGRIHGAHPVGLARIPRRLLPHRRSLQRRAELAVSVPGRIRPVEHRHPLHEPYRSLGGLALRHQSRRRALHYER